MQTHSQINSHSHTSPSLVTDGRRDLVGEKGETLSFWLAPIYFQSVIGRVRVLEKPNQLLMGRSVIVNANIWIIFCCIHLELEIIHEIHESSKLTLCDKDYESACKTHDKR